MKSFGVFSVLALTQITAWGATGASEITTSTSWFNRSRVSALYENEMLGPKVNDQESPLIKEVAVDHYVSAKYKILEKVYLKPVVSFNSNFESEDRLKHVWNDPYLTLGYPITTFSNGVSIFGQGRYYFPLSRSSRNTATDGSVVSRIYVTGKSARWDLLYLLIPKVVLNTVGPNGQSVASHGHWIEAMYNFSDKYATGLSLYPAWKYSKTIDAETGTASLVSEFNKMPAYAQFKAQLLKDLSVTPFLQVDAGDIQTKTSQLGAWLTWVLL